MIVEALGRLGPLVPLDKYRYVGMGSIFFRDFQIIHRRLGINSMVTVEENRRAETRVKFNLPLACINPVMESTNKALPRLQLEDNPYILWLDYESRVNRQMLADVEEVVGRCAAGSVMIVSANVERLHDDKREHWLSEFGTAHDRPEPINPQERSEYAMLSYRLLREEIGRTLRSRNAGIPDCKRVAFRQMFHMVHTDRTPMLTVGGALVSVADEVRWTECGTESLEFTRSGEDSYEVKVPPLTRREILYLLGKMPEVGSSFLSAAERIGIPKRDAKQFASVYRYAPLFVEAEDW